MHFTVHHCPDIDQRIQDDLEIIKTFLTGKISSLVSLLLVGGFGRGEGSVLVEQGTVQILNDYDLVLVVRDQELDPMFLREQARMLAKLLQVRMVDLIPFQLASLSSLPPIQFNYDLKYGSMVVWGEDILPLLPGYRPDGLDLESAQILLVNRMICLLESYAASYEKRPPAGADSFFVYYQSQKVILAIAEALLMAGGDYSASYQQRADRVKNLFPALKSLHTLTDEATAFKLRPTDAWLHTDVVSLWKKAVAVLLKTLFLSLSGVLSTRDPSRIEQAYLEMEQTTAGKTARLLLPYGTREITKKSNLSDIEKAELLLLCGVLSNSIWRTYYAFKAGHLVNKAGLIKVRKLWSWDHVRNQVVAIWFGAGH